MVSKNDITGDAIQTKVNSKAYRDNWEAIFGKKDLPSAVDDAATAMAESAARIKTYDINSTSNNEDVLDGSSKEEKET